MNYFAHAIPFLEEPYFAAGTAVPDWLAVADRRVRVRPKVAQQWVRDRRRTAALGAQGALVAQGIVQHIRDDRRFHAGRAFVELSLGLTAMVRDVLGADTGFRPAFLGHLLVEVLLDASLVAEAPDQVDRYYQALDRVDAAVVEQAVNEMVVKKGSELFFLAAPKGTVPFSLTRKSGQSPTERLAPMIDRFRRERILWDYLEDARLAARLNQVMRRVRLAELPDDFAGLLPAARARVAARRGELLEGIPTQAPLTAPGDVAPRNTLRQTLTE